MPHITLGWLSGPLTPAELHLTLPSNLHDLQVEGGRQGWKEGGGTEAGREEKEREIKQLVQSHIPIEAALNRKSRATSSVWRDEAVSHMAPTQTLLVP